MHEKTISRRYAGPAENIRSTTAGKSADGIARRVFNATHDMRGGNDQASHLLGALHGPGVGETAVEAALNPSNLSQQSAIMNLQGSNWTRMERDIARYRKKTGSTLDVEVREKTIPVKYGNRPIGHEVSIKDAQGRTPAELAKWTRARNLAYLNPYSVRRVPKSPRPRPTSPSSQTRNKTRQPGTDRKAAAKTSFNRAASKPPTPSAKTSAKPEKSTRTRLRRVQNGPVGTEARARADRKDLITKHLLDAGTTNINDHLAGWDRSQPVYERQFEVGERIVQYLSNSSSPRTGQYFGLPGAQRLGEMGIGSGLSGRTAVEFEVVRPFKALEGTAKRISKGRAARSGNSLAGEGGATQIFIPDSGLSSLVGVS